jgi:hypothetical protein
VTSALEPVDNAIDMRLGTTSVFTIHRVDSADLSVSFAAASSTSDMLAVSIDADGNATFAGQLVAAGLTIGTSAKPAGITMYDDSGAAYCTKIVRGQLVTLPGVCGTATSTSPVAAEPNATPSAAPVQQQSSASSTPAVEEPTTTATSTPDSLGTQVSATQDSGATSTPDTMSAGNAVTQQSEATGTAPQSTGSVSASAPAPQTGGDAANQSSGTVL